MSPDSSCRRRPTVVRVLAVVVLSLAATVIINRAHGFGSAQAQTAPRAGLVVQFGDGTVRELCVDLGGEAITGLDLLRRSGLRLRVDESSAGATVCRIESDGCADGASCWCHCQTVGPDCAYWAYSVLDGGRWRYADSGPAARTVRPGDVDGWAWGSGSATGGATPPVRTFEQLCGTAPTAAPARTPAGTLPPGRRATLTGTVSSGGPSGTAVLATTAPAGSSAAGRGGAGRSGAGAPVGYVVFGAVIVLLVGTWLWARRA